jgi:glycosyltransferase involved in cell wall biosynthesis
MKKLLIIQPLLSNYRLSIYHELSEFYDVYLISSNTRAVFGFGNINIDFTRIRRHLIVPIYAFFHGKLIYQSHLITQIKTINPDKIYTYANMRCVSYWILLIYCWIYRKPIYSHCQGPYNKSASWTYKILYWLMAKFSTKVLLYTPYSLKKIKELGLSDKKFRIIPNTIFNSYPICPEIKTFTNNNVLFMGRLREGCNIELLCDTIIELNNSTQINCHIIGSGVLEEMYRNKYMNYNKFIQFHGIIYEQEEIAKISKNCIVGCYPGNAGLSVVHYMSLSLPCLVHDEISKHEGPEPSYVIDKYNGRLFHYDDKKHFKQTLIELLNNLSELKKYGTNAYQTYKNLTEPTSAQQIVNVLESENI